MTLTLSAVYVLCKFIKYLKLKIYYLELEKKLEILLLKPRLEPWVKIPTEECGFWFSLTSERIPRLAQKLITPMGFREAAKKSSLHNSRAVMALSPPPSLMAVRTFFSSVPKVQKKSYFCLNGQASPPPLYGPAI